MNIAWFCHAINTDRGHQIVDELRRSAEEAGFPVEPFVTWVGLGEGFEDITLNKVRAWCQGNPGGLVLYTHDKGSWRDSFIVDKDTGKAVSRDGINLVWRGSMIDRLIGAWASRVEDLQTFDLAGLYWITPENEPGWATYSYFAGNFWWARADYLAKLPPLPVLTAETRYEAESWPASGTPLVKALSEGLKEFPLFTGVPVTKGQKLTQVSARSAEEAEASWAKTQR